MSKPTRGGHTSWPEIDLEIAEDENAKLMLERADALLKAQLDALRAMETRIAGLLAQSVTLTSAAAAATATALAAIGGGTTLSWVQDWMALALFILTSFWFGAAAIAARSMEAKAYVPSGTAPRILYNPDFMASKVLALRLALARQVQLGIEHNEMLLSRVDQRLAWIVRLLLAGPFTATVTAVIWAKLPSLRLLFLGLFGGGF
jgi:hypothetical protein